MNKFLMTSLFLAVVVKLYNSDPIPQGDVADEPCESLPHSEQVMCYQEKLATKVAMDIAPTDVEPAKHILNQALQIVSEVIKSTAFNVCPDDKLKHGRMKRNPSDDLEQTIIGLLKSMKEKTEMTVQQGASAEEYQPGDPHEEGLKLVSDLANAIKNDDERLSGLNDFVVTQLSNVLQATMQAVTAIAAQSCQHNSGNSFCDSTFGMGSSACKQLRSVCMDDVGTQMTDICADAKRFCMGPNINQDGLCKRFCGNSYVNGASSDNCRREIPLHPIPGMPGYEIL